MLFHNTWIIDTTAAVHVWEHTLLEDPTYYVPFLDLQGCILAKKTPVSSTDMLLGAWILTLQIAGPEGGTPRTTDRVIEFQADAHFRGPLAGYVRLEFSSMDQWLEEDIPMLVRPKSPFKRVDILPSNRKIVIKLHGAHGMNVRLAESHFFYVLLETGQPRRYYLPFASVDQEKLRKSDFVTRCPYKGEAEYFDLSAKTTTIANLVWWYKYPTKEASEIAGMLCFQNEKIEIWIDGKHQWKAIGHS